MRLPSCSMLSQGCWLPDCRRSRATGVILIVSVRAAALWIWLATLLSTGHCWSAQPAGAVVPGLDAQLDGVDPGEILIGELGCVSCHSAAETIRERLMPKQAPFLGDIGNRVLQAYIGVYLANPHQEKPGTTMPDILRALSPQDTQVIVRELSNFLLSLSATSRPSDQSSDTTDVSLGRVLYHRTGCVACHPPQEPAADLFGESAGGGPTDPQAVRFVLDNLNRISVPLGKPEAKYANNGLEVFLVDPLEVRPSGRMPSLNLATKEARAIAHYLRRTAHAPAARSAPAFDKAAANRGRQHFANFGCAACHKIGPDKPPVATTMQAPSLASLASDKPGGCLDTLPLPGLPIFHLGESQRAAIRQTLRDFVRIAATPKTAGMAMNAVVRLNCVGCHLRGGGGPTPSRADYFIALRNADLGDEGRLPPHLVGVGRKLRTAWLGNVLVKGGRVRPYLATRMPQFGKDNVASLADWLAEADAGPERSGAVDNSAEGDSVAGRMLVGTNGCACISCHAFGESRSTGISVLDLTRMTPRLNKNWFQDYLIDPQSLRPGTRMPSFWPERKSTVPSFLDGETAKQIDGIWAYLAHGAQALPPPGAILLEPPPAK